MQDFAKGFYDGAAWRACRASFVSSRISIDGGLCQRCRKRLGYIVHHTTELTPENIHDPEIALNHARLEYLCLDCHNMEPGHFANRDGKRQTREFVFDADGDLVPTSPHSREP